jgi:arabinofuranosyltransferase
VGLINLWQRLVRDDRLARRLFWLLSGCVALFWIAVIGVFGATPAEDAFILFRYSENLASGAGISWNPGEGPVEGATDFLWMLLVALLTWVIGDPVVAAIALGCGFIAATVALFYWFFRRLELPFAVFAVVALCYLGTPVWIHVVNGFSPPMFSFMLLASTALSMLVLERPRHFPTLVAWAGVMLLTGLTRPEGNLFCGLLIVIVFALQRERIRAVGAPMFAALLLGYALPGLGYFLWRAEYFDLFWPLPFYLKGLYPGSRRYMLFVNLRLALPHMLVPLLALGAALALPRAARGGSARNATVFAVPALALLVFFLFMMQSQNVVYRFQYPTFAVLLLLVGCRIGESVKLDYPRQALAAITALVVGTLWFTVSALPIPQREDDLIWLGRTLQSRSADGYTLATTEAGRLPYFSKWRTLDTYGLNDPTVATGGFDYAYWREQSPDVVMIHPSTGWDIYSAPTPANVEQGNRRSVMEFMRRDGGWELIAVVPRQLRRGGDRPGDYNLYFIRATSPDLEALRQEMTSIEGVKYAAIPPGVAEWFDER